MQEELAPELNSPALQVRTAAMAIGERARLAARISRNAISERQNCGAGVQ
jgi:hypothetical protein